VSVLIERNSVLLGGSALFVAAVVSVRSSIARPLGDMNEISALDQNRSQFPEWTIALGTDRDAREPYQDNYGRALFACFRS
jgi:hypothetical protein